MESKIAALNAKILDITLHIKKEHVELSKYIEEMPVTIPNEKDPEITVKNLTAYLDSLTSLLQKYEIDQNAKSSNV